MDVFSEILSGIKLNGAVFFNAEFSAPGAVASPPSATLAPVLAPDAHHLIVYHLVVDGSASVLMPDGRSMLVDSGSVIVLPHGEGHLLSSGGTAPGSSATAGGDPKDQSS